MQHVEFFDIAHFEENYYRVKPPQHLAHLIDFFWQTKFEHLWQEHPEGFSDALFPNIGYTYLVNLGTPFIMQVGDKKTEMKSDGFLPRHLAIECFHRPGNILFGIKFRISPVILEKKVNFAEYKTSIFPLSYLIDKQVIMDIKSATNFQERIDLLIRYFTILTQKHPDTIRPVQVVAEIIEHCSRENNFTVSIQQLATGYGISSRTLQRYFEITTSLSSKKTLQILRIRKAAEELARDPAHFNYKTYGYYDYSHFYKHLRQFFKKRTLTHLQPHLNLLKKLHKDA
jgi:AraC-like DNA-binding protein